MSTVELTEAGGAWWSPLLAVVILIGFCAAIWVLLHPRLTWHYLLTVLRRGRAYRRRMRAARHARPHLTFRSPVR